MDVSVTNPRETIGKAKRINVDWADLTTPQRIKWIEQEGFVVLPDLLSPDQLDQLHAELSQLPTRPTDYSDNQRGTGDIMSAAAPAAMDIVAHPAMTEFLTALFGDELICTSCAYAISRPGHPGIAIHTDAQPYGSKIFGLKASSPCLVRALYYLDDLTSLRSPLKVIPRSHLSMHADANPYNRYLRHDQEAMITCKAGSAAIINQKIFHANYPNHSDTDRRMLAIAYRPMWAGPVGEAPEHDPDTIAQLPPHVRPYFKSPNTRRIDFDMPNRPDNLQTSAAGISPGRWGD